MVNAAEFFLMFSWSYILLKLIKTDKDEDYWEDSSPFNWFYRMWFLLISLEEYNYKDMAEKLKKKTIKYYTIS